MLGVLSHLKKQVGRGVMEEEYQVLIEQIIQKTGAEKLIEEEAPLEEERQSMVVMDEADGNINLVQVPRNASSDKEMYSIDDDHKNNK